MASSFVLVFTSKVTNIQLFGVMLMSAQSGIGEGSILALSQSYSQKQHCLVAWSSGTGFAGPAGYLFTLLIVSPFGRKGAFWSGCLLAIGYIFSFFCVLSPPVLDKLRDQPPPPPMTVLEGGDRGTPDDGNHGGDGGGGSYDDDTKCHSRYDMHSRASEEEAPFNSHAINPEKAKYGADDERVQGPNSMSLQDKMKFTAGLWPYTIPLFVVYFAEYSLQAGAWTAIGIPDVASAADRQQFYTYSNFLYQWGVFVSRSSGACFQFNLKMLWAFPMLQCLFFAFFVVVADAHMMYTWGLLFPCFLTGLIGGAVYVNAYTLINHEIEPSMRELALSGASAADSFGIGMSNIVSLFVQACLFQANGIEDQADMGCPWQ
jgi:battenin